ncbi:MAG: nuclear transport factor 2 (NTF2) superfamily protein [Methylophagaceae bacterium]|jgi:nuclear transport factor 2 (NTF2) superfamily protein
MQHRFTCINDLAIDEAERQFFWPLGARPEDSLSLSDLGL